MGKRKRGSHRTPSLNTINQAGHDHNDDEYLDSASRKASIITKINKWDDVELDDVDAFAAQKDKILFDDHNQDDDDQDSEEEVFGLDHYDDEDEDDMDDEQLLKVTRNLRSVTKTDSDEEEGESEGDDEEGADAGWGKSRSAYYDADDVSDNDEKAKEEEEEAMRIRRQQVARLKEEDYMDDFSDSFKSLLFAADSTTVDINNRDTPIKISQPTKESSSIQRKEYNGVISAINDMTRWLESHDVHHPSSRLAMTILMNAQFYIMLSKNYGEGSVDDSLIDRVYKTIRMMLNLWAKHKDSAIVVDVVENADINNQKLNVVTSKITGNGPNGDNDDAAYYEEIKAAKMKAKAGKAARLDESLYDDISIAPKELIHGGKRGVSWNIIANKGLTPKRKKEQRNPRVKKRLRFEKAIKRLSSFRRVAVDKSKVGPYAGESSGIKTHLVRSVKFRT